MADGMDIHIETVEVETMIRSLLKKVENPRQLMKTLQRWIHSQTMRMIGEGKPRPDKKAVRGVKWPELADSTLKQKKALVKRGKAVSLRPMVRTGKLRNNIKVLNESKNGFEYGTEVRSKKGFKYPGFHNTGKFPWLFLTKADYAQITRATLDHIKGELKNFKEYTK